MSPKKTEDGIILNPQPDDAKDDPLNWPAWRRDMALFSIGWHSLVGGGMTPILAAGFNDVATTYDVSVPDVALTTGIYMLGLGIGSLIASPLAILYGKRPVYIGGAIIFMAASIWCALSPTYISLVIARVVMGLGVSPCECLPSATIAEIFFLHERAYRIGIYTLLLLGGKNIVPLVSGVIINSLGWRWVFWIVAIIVGFNTVLLYLFVPETWWDRTPRPAEKPDLIHRISDFTSSLRVSRASFHSRREKKEHPTSTPLSPRLNEAAGPSQLHPHFADQGTVTNEPTSHRSPIASPARSPIGSPPVGSPFGPPDAEKGDAPKMATLAQLPGHDPSHPDHAPPKTFVQQLRIFNGRLRKDSFFKAMLRPMVLFAYPAILWSTVVYSLSIGWLIVLSEALAHIYQEQPYNFSSLATGLVYMSPFIGGIFGTIVAGKLSDVIVRAMAKKNDGVYEPEFRLVMALPITITTAMGLMGFGWSAHEHDHWIVPTLFFGILSFGCSLGSTTSITFCVDSYRQYAGEALVTLNFSKNVFHGFAFSLFFNHWLEHSGPKDTFVTIGGIHVACLLSTVPLYIFGKRARLWTVERNLMAKL